MSFLRTMFFLLTYGFLKEFRLTEPFLYQFEHVTLNLSAEVLNAEVYPIWTYSYLIVLIPVFLLTDLLLYKAVIIAEALSYLTCWLLFDFSSSVLGMQMVEVFYGTATATEIAYYAYVYVANDKKYYKRATSFSRVALLAGRFLSYFLAELIILYQWGDYYTLNYITTAALILAVLTASFLPSIPWRTAYEKHDSQQLTYSYFARRVVRTIWADSVAIYSNGFIFKWSLWWAVASCMVFQIENYMQTLWGSVQADQAMYNGITEALTPIISVPVVLLMEKITVGWERWGEAILMVISMIDAGILLYLSLTPSLFVMYGGYMLYRVLYEATITIAQYNLASQLVKDSFGLLFGLNTFIALILQTLLTSLVESCLRLSIRPQFMVFSGCHLATSIVFGIAAIHTYISLRRTKMAS